MPALEETLMEPILERIWTWLAVPVCLGLLMAVCAGEAIANLREPESILAEDKVSATPPRKGASGRSCH